MPFLLRALSLLLLLLPLASPARSCPPLEFEDLVVSASFVARVVLQEAPGLPEDVPPSWSGPLHDYDAWVVDRVRGDAGKVRLLSWMPIDAREAFVLARECDGSVEDLCVIDAMAYSLPVSLQLGGEGWFAAGSIAAGAPGMTTLELADGGGLYVPWRTLLRAVAGAEDYVACRGEVDAAWAEAFGACDGEPGDAAQLGCVERVAERYGRARAACRR